MKEKDTTPISQAAIKVEVKAPRQQVSKLSQVTRDMIKKRQGMKVSYSGDQAEFAELSKLINTKNAWDMRNYNVGKIEEGVKKWWQQEIIEKKAWRMYALNAKHGNVISNFDDIAKAGE